MCVTRMFHCSSSPFFFFFFPCSFIFVSRTGSLRVIANHSQSPVFYSFSHFYYFCKDIHNSCEGGSKILFVFFFPLVVMISLECPFQSRCLPCFASLTRFIEAVPSCWESFFPQRVHPAVVLNGTYAWKAVVIYALMSFILLKPDAISSVPVPSLLNLLFLFLM